MPQPGMPGIPSDAGKPNNYMALAIIGTILGACGCLSLVTGIISIVFANKVNTCWAQGDVAGAQNASNTAKILVIVTFAIVALGILTNIILFATGNAYWTFSTS